MSLTYRWRAAGCGTPGCGRPPFLSGGRPGRGPSGPCCRRPSSAAPPHPTVQLRWAGQGRATQVSTDRSGPLPHLSVVLGGGSANLPQLLQRTRRPIEEGIQIRRRIRVRVRGGVVGGGQRQEGPRTVQPQDLHQMRQAGLGQRRQVHTLDTHTDRQTDMSKIVMSCDAM